MRDRLVPLAVLLLAVVLASSGFIDLELSLDIGPWHANAPVADVAALCLLPLGASAILRGTATPMPLLPWGAVCAAALVSLVNSPHPVEGAHFLLRKVMFPGAAFGIGVAAVVAGLVPPSTTRHLLVVGMGITGVLSAVTSAARLLAGNALWWSRIGGLTPNHKTLAVALAGGLPLALGIAFGPEGRPRTAARVVCVASLLAILLSLSKAAWLGAAVGIAWFVPRTRPLATRPRVLVPVVALALAVLTALPFISGSRAMLDAARSRHSLNKRAWGMFSAHPIIGAGAGISTEVETVTFPDYRVNGVDAHGVLQKVGGEMGLVGLGMWTWFTASTGRALWRRRQSIHAPHLWGCSGAFVTLHVQLLLSTEAFSCTHWAPLAVAWGLAHAEEEQA